MRWRWKVRREKTCKFQSFGVENWIAWSPLFIEKYYNCVKYKTYTQFDQSRCVKNGRSENRLVDLVEGKKNMQKHGEQTLKNYK